MNPDRQHAIEYLRGPRNGPWGWREDGGVVVWSDGTTIAFREEIRQIIEWLAPGGLPTFGAIVFLLAACRGKVPRLEDIVVPLKMPGNGHFGEDPALWFGVRQHLRVQVGVSLEQLQRVAQLPAELISGMKAKCVLAEAVFEPTKVERHIHADIVLRGMREPMTDTELVDGANHTVSRRYIDPMHLVAEGLKLHSAESLTLRLRTGLDALPKEVDANLPAAERARRLIDELSRDREFGAVARAARELMAAVRLPRRLAEREQLALGGVADITNRGPLDRLLLSELAHDDLSLSVRVALNEALYLRREPPMREPPGALALLLDSGVRMWGVPRVLATAVALALIARDKRQSEILAWRAHGKELKSLELLSRNGLMQHLGALEPAAHPGDSLAAFARVTANNGNNQSVLITHRDALADPEFRRELAANPTAPQFIATLDRAGRFEMHAMPLSHRPPVCEAELDLASVFGEATKVELIRKEAEPGLPAIFGMSPFPFLLPVAGRAEFWIRGPEGITYAVMNDRRLICYRNPGKGARGLASELPGGKTIWMDCDGDELYALKAGASQRPTRLISLPLSHGQLHVNDLISGDHVAGAHRYGDVVLLIRASDVRAYSLKDGRLLGQAANPHRWVHGRFFRGTSHFYFAVWDGEGVKFQPVSMPARFLFSSVTTIFDRGRLPGPWLLLKSGQVVCTASGEIIELSKPENAPADFNFGAGQISKDGNKLLISGLPAIKHKAVSHVFDLEEKCWLEAGYPNRAFDQNPALPAWNVHRHVESIAIFNGNICLCGRKNRWRQLGLGADRKLRITPIKESQLVTLAVFSQSQKTNHGCALQIATLADGSKIFLDSRGLLHFKSANPGVAEVSIVLAEGEVAGWTSDGKVCGPQFFFEQPIKSEPVAVLDRIILFFAKL